MITVEQLNELVKTFEKKESFTPADSELIKVLGKSEEYVKLTASMSAMTIMGIKEIDPAKVMAAATTLVKLGMLIQEKEQLQYAGTIH